MFIISSNTGATKTRPKGMHPQAWKAYIKAFQDSGIEPLRVVQTVAGALGPRVAASGTLHDSDGLITGTKENYSAAVDLSVWRIRGVVRWDEAHIKWVLYNLADEGFAAWYRHDSSWSRNKHIHAVYVAVPMNRDKQKQVADFLWNRDGLATHDTEKFWTAPQSTRARMRLDFLTHNPRAAELV